MSNKVKVIQPQEGFQEKFVRSDVDFCIGGGVLACGKEQPLSSLVLTPSGWARMGSLKVGDLVSTPFGKPQRVLNIFEHKDKDIYEITTSDGRKCRCGLEHLWAFRTKNDVLKYLVSKDVNEGLIVENTASLIERLSRGEKIYIPIAHKQIFKSSKLPIEPYSLGFLVRNGLRDDIPSNYVYSSIRQREDLILGITEEIGRPFSTTNHNIIVAMVDIYRSLGYAPKVTEKDGLYTIGINDTKTIYGHNVFIKTIEKVSKEDTRCIYIDDDMHLYITDDYIVTHNTTAAILSIAEPSRDGRFRGLFLRNNLGDARASGGILDTFKEMYGDEVEVVESGEPRVTFLSSGARIDVTHVADQTRDKVLQRFKGRQYDYIYFDEGTGFTWECFTTIYSRNRGTASWTGKVRMTTNPERDHWLRKFLDWYIGADGFIMEEREGVVRYFFIAGETVDDVVWGDSKEEVYQKCRIQIDRKLAKVNGKSGTLTYKDMIKSFTFYLGKMSENKATLGSNGGYAGSVAVTGGRSSEQLLEGNWNVSMKEEISAPIPSVDANQVFLNDPCINNDNWITADLADTGTDNFLALSWNGFHITDIRILAHSTPRQNAEMLEMFAAEKDIAEDHIIFDGVRGAYINDYLPYAIPFISYRAPRGMYGRMAYNLKAECFMRLAEVIKRNMMSMAEDVARRVYTHQNLRTPIMVQNEFMEECAVVRFREMPGGKKALYTKKEMNSKLGKSRSMDFLDPCAMRMLPVLDYAYGEELEKTACNPNDRRYDDDKYYKDRTNVFDDSFWGVV